MSNMLIKTPPTHQGIKKKIIAFERQFEVDSWVVNGIDVWPYIRIKNNFKCKKLQLVFLCLLTIKNILLLRQ
jgi:hypothetical protein